MQPMQSTCHARGRATTGRTRCRGLADGTATRADVVDDDVLAELVGGGEERAAAVDPGHLLDERGKPRGPLEHERVDDDALARAVLDLLQRFFDGPTRGRERVV